MPIRDELQSLFDTYVAAYQASDASACAAVFTSDGELYSPYAPPTRGRPAIAALHRIWTQDGGSGKQLTIVQASGSGDLAWCLATFSEGEVTGDGTSLNILERQPGGDWLIRMCSLNGNEAQPN
jgi:uncharacterized protein (TIGR02246 family)